MKHINGILFEALGLIPWVNIGGTKFNFFQNMVMLHIKFKEMTYTVSW